MAAPMNGRRRLSLAEAAALIFVVGWYAFAFAVWAELPEGWRWKPTAPLGSWAPWRPDSAMVAAMVRK